MLPGQHAPVQLPAGYPSMHLGRDMNVCGIRVLPSVGRSNEDMYTVCPLPKERQYYGVFDGHGGVSVAQFCSQRLHHLLEEQLSAGHEFDNLQFDSVFLALDAEASNCLPDVSSCGSTAVVALLSVSALQVANIGDSRAILCRAGVALELTTDQRADRPDEAARIEACGGQILWNAGSARVFGVLATTRAVGDSDLRECGVICKPEVTQIERSAEDEFLLLASDGLFAHLTSQHAIDVISKVIARASAKGATREAALRAAADVVARFARDKGSKDDITVLVVDMQQQMAVVPQYVQHGQYHPMSMHGKQPQHDEGCVPCVTQMLGMPMQLQMRTPDSPVTPPPAFNSSSAACGQALPHNSSSSSLPGFPFCVSAASASDGLGGGLAYGGMISATPAVCAAEAASGHGPSLAAMCAHMQPTAIAHVMSVTGTLFIESCADRSSPFTTDNPACQKVYMHPREDAEYCHSMQLPTAATRASPPPAVVPAWPPVHACMLATAHSHAQEVPCAATCMDSTSTDCSYGTGCASVGLSMAASMSGMQLDMQSDTAQQPDSVLHTAGVAVLPMSPSGHKFLVLPSLSAPSSACGSITGMASPPAVCTLVNTKDASATSSKDDGYTAGCTDKLVPLQQQQQQQQQQADRPPCPSSPRSPHAVHASMYRSITSCKMVPLPMQPLQRRQSAPRFLPEHAAEHMEVLLQALRMPAAGCTGAAAGSAAALSASGGYPGGLPPSELSHAWEGACMAVQHPAMHHMLQPPSAASAMQCLLPCWRSEASHAITQPHVLPAAPVSSQHSAPLPRRAPYIVAHAAPEADRPRTSVGHTTPHLL